MDSNTSSQELPDEPFIVSLSGYMRFDHLDLHTQQIPNYMSQIKKLPSCTKQQVNSFTSETKEFSSPIAQICACALEDAIDQLRILGSGLFPTTNGNIGGIEERAKKYCTENPVFDPHSGEIFEENFNKMKLNKLYYDSSKIGNLLTQIKNELKYDQDYTTLTNYMKHKLNAEKEDEQLFANEKENMALMDTLKQTLYSFEKDSKKEIQESNENIATLKDKREDVVYENLIRTRYIETWEKARMSQSEYTYMQTEKKLENTINKYKNKIENEDRANTEIKYFIKENVQDMLHAIDYWAARYDKDSETRRLETQVYKEKRIDLRKEYEALQEMYDLHEKKMNDYLEYKEKKRIEAEILAFRISKAIKLQAWWRGIMVRRKLGRFDPNYMEKQIARTMASRAKINKDKKGKKKQIEIHLLGNKF